MMNASAAGGYSDRTSRFFAAAAKMARTWYDDAGAWRTDTKPAETRERFWGCFALYAAAETRLADAVIRAADTAQYGPIRFNIFDTNIAALLLVQHRRHMAADVRAKLEALVRDGFSFKPGNRQPDYQFHGYNDNMPAEATLGLVLGGELLGSAEAVEYGLWNLRQLRAMLVRNGINSEFNSPTYSPVTLHGIAEIAEHAANADARALALGIEERLWIDLAARYHPPTGVTAGPYARAYTVDTIAHGSCLAGLLWFVLGEGVNPSPMELFAPPPGLVMHHKNDQPFNIAQQCWFAAGAYHLPPAAQRLFAAKTYPFRAVATSEQGDAGPDFPARPCRIETVLTEDFTVATASTSLCGGEQTMTYFVTYRRTKPVRSFRDVGTLFAKMAIDDDVPGTIAHAKAQPDAGAELHPDKPAGEIVYPNHGEEDCLSSRANTVTMQSGTTALVLTHPQLALGGTGDKGIIDVAAPKPIRRISEMVVFGCHFGGADEILVGGHGRGEWSGQVSHGQWIACRRGRLLVAVRPLAYTRTLGPVKITLERVNAYEIIRASLYDGPARTFSRQELRHVFGGFVAEHASVDEYPSLAAFAAEMAKGQFTDYFWTTRRTRYRRPASPARPAVEMEISLSPGSQTPRFAAINGKRVDWPTVEIDGIGPADLPFLNEEFASVPSFFPWKDFGVAWGDWPWAIGDRE